MKKFEIGQNIELNVESISHDARGIAHDEENFVFFIENALPKQKVLAEITKIQKNFAEAKCLEVITQAPYFEDDHCPHQKHCGGCPLQNVAYPLQLDWKKDILNNQLKRIGKLELQASDILGAVSRFNYRNKMEFSFSNDLDERLRLGLQSKQSHKVIDVTACKLVSPNFMDLLNASRDFLAKSGLKAYNKVTKEGYLRYLVIREANQELSLEIITNKTNNKNKSRTVIAGLEENLQALFPNLILFTHTQRLSSLDIAYGETLIYQNWLNSENRTEGHKKYLNENIGELNFSFTYDSFMQVNSQTCQVLYDTIKDFANLQNNQTIWDIYCGVGSISLYLTKDLENMNIFGVDANHNATICAKVNAKKQSLQSYRFLTGDAQKELAIAQKNLSQNKYNIPADNLSEGASPANTLPPDLVILDPSRPGLSKELIESLVKLRAKKVILVSCNPASLSRDLGLLVADYDIKKIQAIDMFPNTSHVECVVLLEKK